MFRTLTVSLLSLLLCASVAFAEKPLVVASDPTFPPNEMLNKDKEIVGFSIDYIKAVVGGFCRFYAYVFPNSLSVVHLVGVVL